jgi:hypothetical protein
MSQAAAGVPSLDEARRHFVELILTDLKPLQEAALTQAQVLADQTAERALSQQRRDVLRDVTQHAPKWPPEIRSHVREQLMPQPPMTSQSMMAGLTTDGGLQLVDDETVQRNILISRLTLALLDRTTWEFADLRARLTQISQQPDLEDDDLFRPQILARCLIKAWLAAGLALESWRLLEAALQRACSEQLERVFHDTNEWLVNRGVLPQVDLRPFIRKAEGATTSSMQLDPGDTSPTASGAPSSTGGLGSSMPSQVVPLGAHISRVMPGTLSGDATTGTDRVKEREAQRRSPGLTLRPGIDFRTDTTPGGVGPTSNTAPMRESSARSGFSPTASSTGTGWGTGGTGQASRQSAQAPLEEETRLMTRHAPTGHGAPEIVFQRFGDILDRHVPGFRQAEQGRAPSQQLSHAMGQVQQRVVAEAAAKGPEDTTPSPAKLIAELRDRQQALKQAAATPEERATVELVALLFQSILTDERIPAALRVWFARLQMPVLRVALAEPDFFSGADHPARRLIDRMGACVMGFEGDAELIGTPLEAEIRRVVQVVEAFPDTGRRVFQAVLNEFEKFLERYFREHNEVTRAGVSLAQQIEQRETLAIQYTIELRKMLNDVPVQDGVRDFLFHIWADVLATTAVRHGPHSVEVKSVRDAAADLMWMASAKTTQDERAEVIRRLPTLLGTVRQGMRGAGLDARRQDDAVKALNVALTAAFSARAVSMSAEQLEVLKKRLETIEEMLPDDDLELDDSWVLDEANHQHEGLEIVAEGGSMPGPSMLAAAMDLQLGGAYSLDYRGRHDTVRLAWQGMHKQLTLFVTHEGRCVLFQKARLAAFLQAGLLVPVEDESLTMVATRDALRKLSADPSRLQHSL